MTLNLSFLASNGYRLLDRGTRSFLLVDGFEETPLVRALPLRAGEPMPGVDLQTMPGRKLAVSVRIDGLDGRFVIRRLAHGGRLAILTGELFFGFESRPFGEVRASLLAREAGVCTPEIVVAGVDRIAGAFYTGTVVTREIEGAKNLWDALPLAGAVGSRALLRAAGAAIRRLHDASILHADLNLKNLLVEGASGLELDRASAVHVLDLDKARVGTALTVDERQANLRRLLRSGGKLDPEGKIIDREAISALVGGYGARLTKINPLEIAL